MNTSSNAVGLQDRRTNRRSKSNESATLWVNHKKARIGVIEYTVDGARLMVRQMLRVGEVVDLLVGDSMFTRKARVAWTTPLDVSNSVIAGFCFMEE